MLPGTPIVRCALFVLTVTVSLYDQVVPIFSALAHGVQCKGMARVVYVPDNCSEAQFVLELLQ